MSDAVEGYETGPDATLRATAAAWERVPFARAVILVEGVSDQIAVETAAAVRGDDLDDVVVFPMGGAQAITNVLVELDRRRSTTLRAGLYDVAEEPFFRRALTRADDTDLEALGFFCCVDDLEDELIRAAGPDLVTRVIDREGDHASFATMRKQPAWRAQPFPDQARRFLGAGARRKQRYAAALVSAIGAHRLPHPLAGILDHVLD